jgi:hypothetical protein
MDKRMKVFGVFAGFAIGLSGSVGFAQDSAETQFVKQVFAQLQPISFQNRVEYCGYIGYDAAGNLAASPAVPGDEASCLANDPGSLDVIASYHTHGGFSEEHYGEIPSGADMEGDEDEGIDGWVATPGGRLWYIDTTDMVTFQVCGVGCLAQDDGFYRGVDGQIAQSYSYKELVRKLDE